MSSFRVFFLWLALAAAWRVPTNDPSSGLEEFFFTHLISRVPPGDPEAALAQFMEVNENHSIGLFIGTEKLTLLTTALQTQLASGRPLNILETGAHLMDVSLEVIRHLEGTTPGIPHRYLIQEETASWFNMGRILLSHSVPETSKIQVSLSSQNIWDFQGWLDGFPEMAPFDLIYFDHHHRNFYRDVQLLLDKGLLNPGAILIVDNCLGKVPAQFLTFMTEDPRFTSRLVDISLPYPDRQLVATFESGRQEL